MINRKGAKNTKGTLLYPVESLRLYGSILCAIFSLLLVKLLPQGHF